MSSWGGGRGGSALKFQGRPLSARAQIFLPPGGFLCQGAQGQLLSGQVGFAAPGIPPARERGQLCCLACQQARLFTYQRRQSRFHQTGRTDRLIDGIDLQSLPHKLTPALPTVTTYHQEKTEDQDPTRPGPSWRLHGHSCPATDSGARNRAGRGLGSSMLLGQALGRPAQQS